MLSLQVLQLDPHIEIERIIEIIRAQVGGTLRRRGVVVGLSGGIDSSVVAALSVRAFGTDKVLGLLMPERDSSDHALRLGHMIASSLGIEFLVEDIAPALETSAVIGAKRKPFARWCLRTAQAGSAS